MEELTGVEATPESRILRGLKEVLKTKGPEKKKPDQVILDFRVQGRIRI
jgi:hypothetical protein